MKKKITMDIKPQLDRAVGIDVHKEKLTVCFYVRDQTYEVKDYGTFTEDLYQLRDDILRYKISDVLMESTGVYWMALCAILTASGIKTHVANAMFVKNMPKEKTDKKDAAWLCKLLVNGQIRDSYVAGEDQRAFRDLCRNRMGYSHQITRSQNRILKFLERRNIKMRSVVSNINTQTARDIVKALSEGEMDTEKLISLCRGNLKKKKELMRKALQGVMTQHDRDSLKMFLSDIAHFENNITAIEVEIQKHTKKINPKLIQDLDEVAGISKKGTEIILAEVGDNVKAWETADKFAAWTGTAPGNRESADKQKYTGSRSGNKYLRTTMVQTAWSVVRMKNSYWRALFSHLNKRMHAKKTILVIARKLVKVIYKVIKGVMTYKEYGAQYFITRLQERLQQKRSHNIVVKFT